MEGVPYPMWIAYLELLWTKLEVSPKSAIEVCCGTGTLCRMLAKKDIQMTGIDLSRAMIDVAIENASRENLDIRFSCQDASTFQLPWRFDAAFSFFDSLNYIVDPECCKSAIARTAEHLAPGSPFVFDLNTAYAFEKHLFNQTDMKPSRKVRYKWQSHYDPESRICRVEMDFWTDGHHFEEVHLQRAHSQEEISSWMKAAGFTGVAFYHAYTLDRPKGTSDRIHIVGIAP